jgi:paraquat-inducible protein B
MVQGILADDSAPRYELDNALKELAGAARSMRLLAAYLEEHPESLIHGKGPFNKVQ